MRLFAAPLVFLICIGATDAPAIDRQLAQIIVNASDTDRFPVMVKLRPKVDPKPFEQIGVRRERRKKLIGALRDNAFRTQPPILRFFKRKSITRVHPLWLVNGFAVTASKSSILELSHHRLVENITLDAAVGIPLSPSGSYSAPEWNLEQIRAPLAWARGIAGQGVVVGMLDTGADIDHADIGSTWRGGGNSWFDPFGEHSVPYDALGHGTQALGIVLGGSSTGSAIGVAPAARWIAARLFNDRGVSTLSAIHRAFQWLIDPDGDPTTDDAPAVVNGSWGLIGSTGICVLEFVPDIEALRAADIAVVFSAGNDGPQTYTSISPANYAQSISTGAVDETSSLAAASSRGPSACGGAWYPRLVAPGVNIKTADLSFGGLIPGAHTYVSGTSFAAPHITGSIALLRSAYPSASVAQIEDALEKSSIDLGPPGPDNEYGYGLIDALAALDSLTFDSATATPTALPTATVTPTSPATVIPSVTPSASPTDTPSPTVEIPLDLPSATTPKPAPSPGGIPTSALCNDADADGFPAQSGCLATIDCNDEDEKIFPGACEVRGDQVDQDCNGYDLTIVVHKVTFREKSRRLEVTATSRRGRRAGLQVAGYGKMRWIERLDSWRLVKRLWNRSAKLVIVRGVEGSVGARVKLRG